jgi:hypothetical protein
MPISIPSGRTLPLQSKAGGGFRSFGFLSFIASSNWLAHSQASRAPAPLLRFTDLISGPATGLGDSLGSGVIVTIWAQGVGDTQGTSQVYFTDLAGTKRPAEYVYYWKRADGVLPSGPARLWYSHLMQEIAFSIPAGSVSGAGTITVEKGAQVSNALPFTIRTGSIYHVDASGNDSNNGSFAAPWLTWDDGPRFKAGIGSTTYFHNFTDGSFEVLQDQGIYWNGAAASGDTTNQWAIVAYPGFTPTVIAQKAIPNFAVTGQVVSKWQVYSSNYLQTDANGQPVIASSINNNDTYGIQPTGNGRVVANRVQDIPGGMSTKFNGAINGNGGRSHNAKLFGNEVTDHGDAGSSRLEHTTYMSNRAGITIEAWEWGWNFIHSSAARWGIHQYDENDVNGNVIGTLKIHDNFIADQGGGGISIGVAGGAGAARWTCNHDLYNNIVVNAGLPSDWDGIDPNTSVGNPANGAITLRDTGDGTTTGMLGAINMEHNLAYKYNGMIANGQSGALTLNGASLGPTYAYDRNVAYSDQNVTYVSTQQVADPAAIALTGNNNGWFNELSNPINSVVPTFDASPITANPLIIMDGPIVTVASSSPLKNQATRAGHDFYGVPRTTTGTLGPVEASL